MVQITPETLRAAGDCGEGLDLLAELGIPEGYVGPWTLGHQCALLWHPEARRHLGWLALAGLVPLWSMAEIQAPRADLSYADLSGAYLCWARLRGANLRWAHLRGADLRGADLRWAHLRGADLRGADLCGAHLRGADLRGADLRGADLRWANLRGADLDNWERGPDGYAREVSRG